MITQGAMVFPVVMKQEGHAHVHGPSCGHTAVKHDGHIDYLHDGHLLFNGLEDCRSSAVLRSPSCYPLERKSNASDRPV